MIEYLKSLFTTPSADQVRQKQLAEAERLALECEATAEEYEVESEHRERLACMYRARAERLKSMAVGTEQ